MAVAQSTAGRFAKPTRWSKLWESISLIFDSRVATIGLAIVVFWGLIGLISIFWTPYAPNANAFAKNLPPNAVNWLGTDLLGRDILSRLMQGTQVILLKTRLPGGIIPGGVALCGCFWGDLIWRDPGLKRWLSRRLVGSDHHASA